MDCVTNCVLFGANAQKHYVNGREPELIVKGTIWFLGLLQGRMPSLERNLYRDLWVLQGQTGCDLIFKATAPFSVMLRSLIECLRTRFVLQPVVRGC